MVGVEVECAKKAVGEVGDVSGFDGVRTASLEDVYGDDGSRVTSEEVATFLRPLGAGKSGRAEVGGGKAGRGMLTAIAGSLPQGPERSRAVQVSDALLSKSQFHTIKAF